VIWYARGAHQGDADCKGYAIATQFSFVASFMWFIVRTMDLHRMIKDPFSFFSSVTKKYHLIAWGVSSISVLILAFPFTTENFEKDAGDADMFGEDDYGLCWIKEVHDFNWYKFGCFTMPMTFAMAYGVYVLYLCGRYFGVGHSGTESVRQKVLQTARNQVLGFFIWWCATFLVLVVSWSVNTENEKGDQSLELTIVYATLLALRGFLLDPILFLLQIRVRLVDDDGDWVSCNVLWRQILNLPASKPQDPDEMAGLKEEDDEERARAGSVSVGALNRIKDSAFELLTADIQESVLTASIRTDFIAAVSRGIEMATSNQERLYGHRVGVRHTTEGDSGWTGVPQGIDQVIDPEIMVEQSRAVMQVLKEEDFVPEPVEVPLAADKGLYDILRSSGNKHCIAHADKEGQWVGCTFYDYCPMVFHGIRLCSGLSRQEYLESIQGHETDDERLTSMVEKFSEGRSASFFYFTHDKRFMVKTVSAGERKAITDMLEGYSNHLATYPDTFINKIFGCHGIQLHKGEKIKYFIVMESVMWTGNSIQLRADLKGSWVDRRSYKKKKGREKLLAEYAAGKVEELIKDEDLKAIDFHVYVAAAERQRMLEQLNRDAELFEKHNIMDYSMLLAVHTRHTEKDNHTQVTRGYKPMHRRCDAGILKPFQEGDAPGSTTIYYMGVIDITQLWDSSKSGENFAKGTLLCKGHDGISAVNPKAYRQRYMKGMEDLIVGITGSSTGKQIL